MNPKSYAELYAEFLAKLAHQIQGAVITDPSTVRGSRPDLSELEIEHAKLVEQYRRLVEASTREDLPPSAALRSTSKSL